MPQQQMAQSKQLESRLEKPKYQGFLLGIGITLVIAMIAKLASGLPVLSIMGQLVIAILIGMIWRAALRVPTTASVGIAFSSKKLLRVGIILLGMRLNFHDILNAGSHVFILSVADIAFAFFVIVWLSRLLNVERKLGILTACGTAICGAAAIAAIAPQVKASDEETAVGTATIAVLGTLFTLAYTLLYPVIGLTAADYGIFTGATLHEIAHVIAAAVPGGKDAVDLAVIVKLTRVALLAPVAVLLGLWIHRTEGGSGQGSAVSWRSIPFPWFIVGFLLMSAINTWGSVPVQIAGWIVTAAYLFMAMAMAGLGLNVDASAFKRLGLRSLSAGLIGSVLLSGFGYGLVRILIGNIN